MSDDGCHSSLPFQLQTEQRSTAPSLEPLNRFPYGFFMLGYRVDIQQVSLMTSKATLLSCQPLNDVENSSGAEQHPLIKPLTILHNAGACTAMASFRSDIDGTLGASEFWNSREHVHMPTGITHVAGAERGGIRMCSSKCR